MKSAWLALSGLLYASTHVGAIELDVQDENSIKAAARTIAWGMMNYYTGNQTGQIPGLLPGPYYWWQAGAMFGSMIDYWYYTGDSSYNDVVTEAMLFQVGDYDNYMPTNQTRSLGNDDQAFWALAAMSAAEVNFPNPPEDKPQWLALAQGVFNSQAYRWDKTSCGGGLKWQIFSFNAGYSYKNSISNGCFFNLAARLGAYTGNTTYLKHAAKVWDWSVAIGLIDDNYQVWDGTESAINCTRINYTPWTYNSGVYLLGAATMWNQTAGEEQKLWEARVNGLFQAATGFFYNNVMWERCETDMICNNDQLSFKAYLARWMAASTKLAPWLYEPVLPLLAASAAAAAKVCTGGDTGQQCGTKWTVDGFDGLTGVGQQMSALEVVQSNLIVKVSGPVSHNDGGTSKGDPSAGVGADWDGSDIVWGRITAAQRAGAWIATIVTIASFLGIAWWMVAT